MIKNLLNADEEPPEGTKVIIEETIVTPSAPEPQISEPARAAAPTREVFEIPEETRFFKKDAGADASDLDEAEIEAALAEIGIDIHAETDISKADPEPEKKTLEQKPDTIVADSPDRAAPHKPATGENDAPTIFQSNYQPESTAETIRNSGMAYSAAIVLFGAVVLMMIFGWIVDLLLGTSPWGIVGGIVLGGIIGFVQFFRITSNIFKK